MTGDIHALNIILTLENMFCEEKPDGGSPGEEKNNKD
jgi:hypothetical protein